MCVWGMAVQGAGQLPPILSSRKRFVKQGGGGRWKITAKRWTTKPCTRKTLRARPVRIKKKPCGRNGSAGPHFFSASWFFEPPRHFLPSAKAYFYKTLKNASLSTLTRKKVGASVKALFCFKLFRLVLVEEELFLFQKRCYPDEISSPRRKCARLRSENKKERTDETHFSLSSAWPHWRKWLGGGCERPKLGYFPTRFFALHFPQLSCQLCVGGAVQSKPNFIKFHFLRTLSIAETSKTSPSILCTTFYLSEAVVSFQWKKWSTSPLWTTKDKEGWKSK